MKFVKHCPDGRKEAIQRVKKYKEHQKSSGNNSDLFIYGYESDAPSEDMYRIAGSQEENIKAILRAAERRNDAKKEYDRAKERSSN